MAVPKRRQSLSRSRNRYAHFHLTPSQLVPCPRCSQPKKPHFVCGNCGYYRGRQEVDMEKKKK